MCSPPRSVPSPPKGQRRYQPPPRREAHDAPAPRPQRYAQPHGRRTFLIRQRPPELAPPIEASKRSAAEEANRHKGDSELEEALRLSREEDERRRRALEAGAGDNLFDEEQQRSVSRTLLPFVRYHAVGLPSFLRLAMAEWVR